MKKREIEFLITTAGQVYTPCPIGEFQMKDYRPGNYKDECSIKHLGRQIYLIGYYDSHKAGGWTSGKQNRINKYIIVFPTMINKVSFK